MQRYMKSALPYHGVPLPALRAICRDLFAKVHFVDRGDWERATRAIWSGAQYREEWYAALILTGHRAARPFQTPDALPLYEQLIVDGAWWDVVDDVAIHRVGPILRAFPELLKPTMRKWANDPNLWKRRASIICQVGSKEASDFPLMQDCIAPSISSREFFLRKGIGWALREYAKVNPEAVIAYVHAHTGELSPLSKREALRHQPQPEVHK